MLQSITSFRARARIALAAVVLASCGGSVTDPCVTPVTVTVAPRELVLFGAGQAGAFTARVSGGRTDERVRWETSGDRGFGPSIVIDSTTTDGAIVFFHTVSAGAVRLNALPTRCPGAAGEAFITVGAIPHASAATSAPPVVREPRVPAS
jgi:hypothetical protein